MSTQQHVSSIARYKKYAFLKYCNENGIRKNQLDESLILNKLHKLGLFCFIVFFLLIIIIILRSMVFMNSFSGKL